MNLIERVCAMWNTRNLSLAPELYTVDYCGLDMTTRRQVDGPTGIVRQMERIYRAFPDLQISPGETVFENQRAAVNWRARGTHRGIVMNIPPTGQTVQINGVSFLTLESGKISQAVHLWDMAAMLRTLGLLPELETDLAVGDTLLPFNKPQKPQ